VAAQGQKAHKRSPHELLLVARGIAPALTPLWALVAQMRETTLPSSSEPSRCQPRIAAKEAKPTRAVFTVKALRIFGQMNSGCSCTPHTPTHCASVERANAIPAGSNARSCTRRKLRSVAAHADTAVVADASLHAQHRVEAHRRQRLQAGPLLREVLDHDAVGRAVRAQVGYGLTKLAAISRASSPSAHSLRAQ
jgi:hypothetical protein